jgi:hypothetical protein
MIFRLACAILLLLVAANGQEVLYNGIRLPKVWPPRDVALTNEPIPEAPYLAEPPSVIPIDVGRQLFVDDFLIEKTDLRRVFHRPELYSENPVLKGDRPWENGHAMPYSGGVFYDPADQLFKAWYGSGGTLYATSRDGVHWDKPLADVKPGTNAVETARHDSSTVWLDLEEKDPRRRFKMGYSLGHAKPYLLFVSADGIHWGEPIAKGAPAGDRTTFFKNSFRNVWVASLRDHDWTPPTSSAADWAISKDLPEKYKSFIGRLRCYWESPEFEAMAKWPPAEDLARNPGRKWQLLAAPLWVMADRLDPRHTDLNVQPELYNLDAVAYESLMLGLFAVWPGNARDDQKMNYLTVGYSRDGFHWSRPDRRPFIAPTGKDGDWNHANIQSAGGLCLIVGDRLYIYFSARAGTTGTRSASGTSMGLATIRRDGFASMDADSTARSLTTRPVRFAGKRLFVNVDSTAGEMRVEVLDANNKVLKGYSADDCMPLRIDNTLAEVRWRSVKDLPEKSGQPVKFRFLLRNARLFAFWVSPDERGSSNGYVAAGGPGLTATRDTEGNRSYQFCCRPLTW